MLQRRNNQEPPKVMTWGKASLPLSVAVIFDLLRAFFQMFWFLGPALAALYCTAQASDALASWTFGLLGAGTAAVACSAVAAVGGSASVAVTAPFGVVMAIAVGFAGWLFIGGWLMMTNARIFKENGIWFAASLAVSAVPLVGAVPALTGTLWRMYSRQIKLEKSELKKWEKETAAARLQERNQRAAQIAHMQAAQQAQFIQQEAANDEIPEDEKLAA